MSHESFTIAQQLIDKNYRTTTNWFEVCIDEALTEDVRTALSWLVV